MPNKQYDSVAFHQKLAEYNVPEHLWRGLWDYYNIGTPTGSYLDAVLRNDLKLACAKADIESRTHIWELVSFLWNVFPTSIWGSTETVTQYLERNSAKLAQG